jgi:hypothetical protein
MVLKQKNLASLRRLFLLLGMKMVGVKGFEPAVPCTPMAIYHNFIRAIADDQFKYPSATA